MPVKAPSPALRDTLLSHLAKLDHPTLSLLALLCAVDKSEIPFLLSLDQEEKTAVIHHHLLETYRSNHLAKTLGLPRSLSHPTTG